MKRASTAGKVMTVLSDALCANLFQRIGSGQHLELAGFIREARKVEFSAGASEAVRKLWKNSPWTVESNLDLVIWPGVPTWYELPGQVDSPLGVESTVAFLLLPHPEEDGLYMVVTAVRSATVDARHCFAVALLDVASLSDNAVKARRFYSRTAEESVERVMMEIGVSISDDFRDELMITEDGREEVVEAAMRDATAEVPILLTILAAESASNGFLLDMGETASSVDNTPLPTRSGYGRLSDILSRRLSSGLIRKPRRNKTPRLQWFA